VQIWNLPIRACHGGDLDTAAPLMEQDGYGTAPVIEGTLTQRPSYGAGWVRDRAGHGGDLDPAAPLENKMGPGPGQS